MIAVRRVFAHRIAVLKLVRSRSGGYNGGMSRCWSTVVEALRFGLFPPLCLLCAAAGAGRRDLCAGCAADLAYNHHGCRCCAVPLNGPALICGGCLRRPPYYAQAVAPLLYRPPLDRLIRELKFDARLEVAPLLAELLADALAGRPERPQGLLAVPLHPRRLRQRGYNQAAEIARPLARRLALPFVDGVLRRQAWNGPQSALALAERERAVRGAFTVADLSPAWRYLAVVDDVMTSGCTLNEVARVLRAAGVERVEVWACARTARR